MARGQAEITTDLGRLSDGAWRGIAVASFSSMTALTVIGSHGTSHASERPAALISSPPDSTTGGLWGVVLSGGEGIRLRPLTRVICGDERASAAIPVGNFSRDVLQNLTPLLAVTRLTGVTWCDWGSPRRVVERLGIRPPWLDRLTEPVGAGSER